MCVCVCVCIQKKKCMCANTIKQMHMFSLRHAYDVSYVRMYMYWCAYFGCVHVCVSVYTRALHIMCLHTCIGVLCFKLFGCACMHACVYVYV